MGNIKVGDIFLNKDAKGYIIAKITKVMSRYFNYELLQGTGYTYEQELDMSQFTYLIAGINSPFAKRSIVINNEKLTKLVKILYL